MRYEVHRHAYVTGPLPRGRVGEFEHAHEGGDAPHRHPDTGPGCYTIDRDAWRAATGLVGGGRKRYERKPTAPHLEYVPTPPKETEFDVIFVDDYTAAHAATGMTREHFEAQRAAFQEAMTLHPAAARMKLGHGLRPTLWLVKP